MSAINTNVSSLIAQNALRQNNAALQTSLTRLSTGLKINTGEDDPSGLIAANDLKDQQAGINQAISNAQQANNVIGTAAGGLTEVSSLLTQLQSLVSETANSGGLSSTQVSANQQQVDSILSTINRVAGSTAVRRQAVAQRQLCLHHQQHRHQRICQHPGQCRPAGRQQDHRGGRAGHQQRHDRTGVNTQATSSLAPRCRCRLPAHRAPPS
jgi:hypothetical protein